MSDPEFKLTDGFVVIPRRKPGVAFESVGGITPQVTPEATPEVIAQATAEVTAQGIADEGVKTVLAFIRNNPLGRVPAIAEGTGIQRKTIERYIKKL